jgi:hypothetical protein
MRFPAHAATTPKSINEHTEGKRSFAGRKATQCYAKFVDLTETAEECSLVILDFVQYFTRKNKYNIF